VQLPQLSLEYLRVAWSATISGVLVDPTNPLLSVQLAFPRSGAAPAAWYTASWEADGRGGWWARCLLGPGGAVTLVPGAYDVWVKVTMTPEIPARKSPEQLRIT